MVTELQELLQKFPNYNMDKIQRNIICSLQNNPNIILLNLDKGQGLVAMDRNEYMTSMLDQHCNNAEYYKPLTSTQAALEMSDAAKSTKKHVDNIKNKCRTTNTSSFSAALL